MSRDYLTRCRLLAAIIVLGCHSAAQAGFLYSVDINTDQLVKIDATTGQVTVVGGLGRPIDDMDLTILNGKLYGLSAYFGEKAEELLEINQLTGVATLLGYLSLGGTPTFYAEGLASAGGKLYAGFRMNYGFESHILGELALNGQITNPVDQGFSVDFLPSNVIQFDIDGLAANPSGQLYSVDTTPSFAPPANQLQNRLSTLQYPALSPVSLGKYSAATFGGVSDIVFADGKLYGIDPNFVHGLHVINPANGSLVSQVALSRNGAYYGIAEVPSAPEPSTMALLGIAGLFHLLGKRRKSAN